MFSKGELVRWYELYGDVHIVKDYGLGVVLDKKVEIYGDCEIILYSVYANKKNKVETFEEFCLEKLKENKNEIK